MQYKSFIFFLLVICISDIKAQNKNHLGVFPTIDHTGILADKISYGLYYFGAFNLLNPENNNVREKSNLFMLYAEQSLSFKIDSNLSFTGSYVFQKERIQDSKYTSENRFYAQGTYSYKHKKTILKHRLRYDGRFIKNPITQQTPYTSRIRYLMGLKKDILENKFYLNMYNEFFLNTFKGEHPIYGENWVYIAIGKKISESQSIECGPLYIFWVLNSSNQLNNLWYFQLSWNSVLNFRKQK